MFPKVFALLLLSTLAAAQYGGPVNSPATTASTAATVAPTAPPSTAGQINIEVASQGNLVFSPANISAPVGTLVTFYFPNLATNHSVTQSTFSNPCTYLAANTSTNASAGFDSGLISASTFTINITDTDPIWYFCNHPLHCGLGMVGSINAPTTGNTYSAFLAAAMAIGSSEVTMPDNGPVVAGVHATATGPPVPDITTAAPPASGAMKVTTSIGFALFAVMLGVAMA